MKQFYFLDGYARAGNTLLSSIINQNPKVIITANSPVLGHLWDLYKERTNNFYKNFPDKKGLENVTINFFKNYYEHYNAEIIFDRGSWGTPDNLTMLKTIIENPKFLVLVRPLVEVLASYVKVYNPVNPKALVTELMHPDRGKIYKDWLSTTNLINSYKNNCLIINYNSLVNHPDESINKIYNFFNLPNFTHAFNNIKQLEINGIKYDDSLFNAELHKIKPFIYKEEYDINNYLPKDIINMYKNWDKF
jgi:hypothetical protein